MDTQKLKELLESRLTEKRYYHSLCVADEAKRLAEKYGADADKAYLAGLLHDVTKNSSVNEHLNIFNDSAIILTDIEQNALKLWHAISGAAYVENVLNIKDKDIISAIRYHTTARENMSLFEKVLYIADFTSKDRDYDDVEVMRNLSNESLEKAMEYALNYTIRELCDKKAAIHPDTLKAYNQLILRNEEK